MSKQNLIIIHGFLQNFSCFPKFIDNLKQNFNIINIDLPGYGKNYNNHIIDIDQYLKFIYQEIINNLSINTDNNIYLLGWSLGGNIAILLANKYPSFFKKVILLCSNPCFVKSATNKYGLDKDIFFDFYNNIQTNIKKTSEKFLKLQLLGLEKDKFKSYYFILKELFYNQELPNLETLIFNLDILNQDIRTILENLKNDIIFILSDNDYLIPIDIIEYFKKIKKNNDILYLLSNSTHVPMLTNKDMLQSRLFELG